MARLFEISQEYEELIDKFDAINSYEFERNEFGNYIDDDGNVVDPEKAKAEWLDAWFDTLSMIEAEFEDKASNIAQYMKSLTVDVKALKEEKKRIDARVKAKENQLASLKEYLIENMKQIGIKKIDTPKAVISLRKVADSVKIDDEDKFIDMLQHNGRDDLLRYAKPSINKTEIKTLLKSGETFEGARLESGTTVTIK